MIRPSQFPTQMEQQRIQTNYVKSRARAALLVPNSTSRQFIFLQVAIER
jgi:hypothetical protein